MRNSNFNLIFCICAFLSPWLLSGAEEKCVGEVLEFPGVENHRFTAPDTTWLNFSFNVRDEACVTAKPFEIRVYRGDQPQCILKTASGKCTVIIGKTCGCSGRAMQFTFSKKMEAYDARKWKWTVRHVLDEIDHCVVTFGLNPSQESIVESSSEYCKNRVSSIRNIITSTLPDIITRMQAKSTSSIKTDVHRDDEQEIVLRASSENLTAVLGETKHVDFLVPTYKSRIENCMLSQISHNAGGGRDSMTAPANHTCAVELETQDENDQRGGKSHISRPTGFKCTCRFFSGKDTNGSLTVYLFDSRVADSGRWSVRVNNTHGRGHAEFTLIVTDITYAVRQKEVDYSLFTITIVLALVGVVVVGVVSFLCWKRKTKAEPQEPQYSSIPIIRNSLAIRKLHSTSSTPSMTNLSNQTQSSRPFSKSTEETKNRQTEDQVQETNAPTNVVCEVNCSNEPVVLDTGVKMSCSAVDMKLVLYIKGCPVNPETPPVASPSSAEPEYLNPCSPMYVAMDTVEKRNRPQTYQNDMAGDRYMSMSPPRYCSMPRSMTENSGVGGGVSSDPQMNFCNTNYDMNEENYDTKILHLNCMSAYEKKIAEVSEFEKNIAEVSEYSVIS